MKKPYVIQKDSITLGALKKSDAFNMVRDLAESAVRMLKQEKLEIEILDNGGGIKNEIISRIFEPYFTTKKDGMGLGLYMAKIIIEEKMNGMITVRNDSNNVVFTIKLPHKKV